ncbi:hypothetical protein AB205_0114140, partial [Aquarana catesbeiana]
MRALYTIQLGERITCQRCSQQRTSNSDLLAIPLRLSYSKFHRKLTLERTLWRYFRSHETHDDRNLCPKCKSSRIVKVTHLRSLPRTLNIHLKRLSQKNPLQKVNRTLSFPPVLDLHEVLDPEHLPPEEYSMVRQYIILHHLRYAEAELCIRGVAYARGEGGSFKRL